MGKYKRASGILVHITSLPGPNGIGDLGREAYKFVDFLKECDQSIWQILPLTATELPSPYTGISAFAGNALLISLEKLVNDKLLEQSDIESNRPKFDDQVNFKQVNKWKYSVLRRAYQKYKSQFVEKYRSAMQQFIEKERYWLDDFTLYMALKNEYNEKSWSTWAKDLKERKAEALEKKRQEHADLIHEHTFYQYIFFQQWNELKAYANQAGIQIFGDMPVYVDYNSADCWANQSLFQLDEETRLPTAVAGAPPDMFSEDGQLWNSPLYDWTGNMRKNKFDWWIKRIRKSLETVDVVRIDHFRGLEAYWSIPVGPDHVALSPKKGQWVKACGDDFLSATMEALGKDLPIIAEDLGSLTQEVFDLRDKFNLVGMRVLHFGFLDVPESIHLPHNYIQNCIAYTGTHDNNTTIAWYRHNTSAEEKENMVKYLQKEGDIERNIHWSMIQLVMASVADSAVIPFQDVLGLAEGCRMNDPALPPGYEENWRWRFQWSQLNQEMKDKLKLFTNIYGRTTVDKSAAMETTSASQDEKTIPNNKTDTKSAQKVQSSS